MPQITLTPTSIIIKQLQGFRIAVAELKDGIELKLEEIKMLEEQIPGDNNEVPAPDGSRVLVEETSHPAGNGVSTAPEGVDSSPATPPPSGIIPPAPLEPLMSYHRCAQEGCETTMSEGPPTFCPHHNAQNSSVIS